MPASAHRSTSPKIAPDAALTVAESPKPARSRAKQPAAPAANSRPKLSVVGPKATPKPNLTEWAAEALEDSRSNTFLCDPDFNILYANKKSYDILAFMEPNLRAHSDTWKSFAASDVVGMNLSFLFADEPIEFRRAADQRNLPYQSRIKTGPCVCDIQITGLRDKTGQLNGYSVDWERITDKLAQERRVQSADDRPGAVHGQHVPLRFKLERALRQQEVVRHHGVHGAEPARPQRGVALVPGQGRHRQIAGLALHRRARAVPPRLRPAQPSVPVHHPDRSRACATSPSRAPRTTTGDVTGYAVYWERITDKVKMEAQVNAQLEEGKYLAAKIEEMKVERAGHRRRQLHASHPGRP